MRFFTKIIITVCLLFSILSKGQTSLFFDNYYKIGYNNAYNSQVLYLADSTYVFHSVIIDSATGRQDVGLYQINKYGNLLNSRIINYANVNGGYYPYKGFNSFIKISNSSFFTVGATYKGSDLAVLFSKIDSQTLDTIKNVVHCIPTIGYHVGNVIKMNSNKYLVVGNKFDATLWWPVVFELDSNLNIISLDTCANPNGLITYTAKHDYINKKLIFGGNKMISSNSYGFIAVADTLGNILNTYINNDGVGNGISQVFYNSYDNTYVTVGCNKTGIFGSDDRYKLQVCKYTTGLVSIWKKSYGFSNISTFLNDLTFNSDGSMVAVGMYCDSLYNTGKLNYNGAMLKIRSNGDSLWMRTFDNYWYSTGPPTGFIWETLYSIEKTPEGGYIMCGTPTSLPKAKAWVIKTDSLGCELSSCMSAGIKENKYSETNFNIYPNPTSNTIYFSDEQNEFKNSEIEIINCFGQPVLKTKFKSELDVSELSNGVYTMRLKNSENLIGVKRLVIAK